MPPKGGVPVVVGKGGGPKLTKVSSWKWHVSILLVAELLGGDDGKTIASNSSCAAVPEIENALILNTNVDTTRDGHGQHQKGARENGVEEH
jgi:hypothetical protein